MKDTPATTRTRSSRIRRAVTSAQNALTWALGNERFLELDSQIQAGLDRSRLSDFQKASRLPPVVVRQFVSPNTRPGRPRTSGVLTSEESERLVRLSLLYARSVELFEGNESAAARWLNQ